jgi:hypothetical protein
MTEQPTPKGRLIGLLIVAAVLAIALFYLARGMAAMQVPKSTASSALSGAAARQEAAPILKSNEIPAIEADLDLLDQELELIEAQVQ